MSIFSKDTKKDDLTFVFNVGSSSVGGVVFKTQSSGVPKIIFSVTEHISIEEKIDVDRFLALTIQSLGVVVKKVSNARLGSPSGIFCVLSSPWYVSQTRMISLKKNNPFIFTAKLADELMQKEIKIFEEENFKKYGSSVRTIELKNIKTILNGYETPSPLNQKAKEIQMTIFVSISGEQVLKKVEETISKYFHIGSLKFSSFAMASFAVMRDLCPEQENFILVDVGGETTDIFIIKKGALHESISFPLGCNFLTREFASALHCERDEAKALISLVRDGHAEEKISKKIIPIIENIKTKWQGKFQESLVNISRDVSAPSTIYLTTDKEMAVFFLDMIKTEQFSQYTLAESKFRVILLDTQVLHGAALFGEDVVREPSLILNSVYINRFLIKR